MTLAFARDATSWERLAFFQHYGIPTRLLDWTESLGVALFFAVKFKPERPHLWMANAFRLNKSNGASERPRILLAGLDPLPDYLAGLYVTGYGGGTWEERKARAAELYALAYAQGFTAFGWIMKGGGPG